MPARSVAALGLLLCCLTGCPGIVGGGCDIGTPHGAAGSKVWFESSTAVQVTRAWSSDYPGPPQSGATCATFLRTEMTSDQLAALDAIVLVPATDSCTLDGYDYTELKVIDQNGSSAVYRDTGCSYLRVSATVMLPSDALPSTIFPTDSTTTCN